MNDFSLIAYTGTIGKDEDLKVRKIKPGVTDEEIKNQTKKNGVDEVVVKDDKGDRFIIYADELTTENGDLSKLASAKNVVFFEDEPNENVGEMASATSEGTIGEQSHIIAQEIKVDLISEAVSDAVKNEVLKNIK